MATVNGLEHAFFVSHNRESSARAAHNSLWVTRQTDAMGRLATSAAQAINQLVTSVRSSQSTLDVGFPGLAPPRIKRSEALVRAHGLPASFVRLARKYRVPGSLLAAATRKLKSGAAPPSYATSSYGVLSYPPLISAEQSEANALLAYGQLLLTHG